MSFSFGGTSSGGGSGVFGQPSNTSQTSTPSTAAPNNPFSAPALTQSPFGATTSQPASTGGLFGSLAAGGQKPLTFGSSQASGASTPSIFGGGTGNTGVSQAGRGLGGGTATAGGTTALPTGLFSFTSLEGKETSAASKIQAPQQPQSNPFGTASPTLGKPLFGSIATPSAPVGLSTPVTTKPPSLFNFTTSTTPAGPPPAGNNAGAKAPETGFLGIQRPPTSAAQPPSMFGVSTAGGSGSSLFGTTPAGGSGTSLFGKSPAPAPGGGLFGPKPTPPTSGPNMFASLNQPATSTPAGSGAGTTGNLTTIGTSTPTNPTTTTQNLTSLSAGGAQTLFANFGKPGASTAPAPQSTSAPTSSQGPAPTNMFAPKTSEATSASSVNPPIQTSALFPPKSTDATSGPATTTSAPVSSLFPPKTIEAPPASAAAASAPGSNPPQAKVTNVNGGVPATGGSQGNFALGASTTGPPSHLSRLKNKTMDEIITRWATDLSTYQNEFQKQAAKAAAWDRLLVDNGEKIQKLYSSTFEAERASAEVERQLASVEGQQDELAAWLDRYEGEIDQMFAKQVGPGESLLGPDQDRERTYSLAEKLADRLDEMGKDLTNMIQEINDASATLTKTSKADDPLSQIVRVLNGHLSQLQWIDQNATLLREKVDKARKDGHGLSTNGHGGEDDAVDDFYRSYMGRR